MFRTHLSAEMPIPSCLQPRDVKSWRWIELSLQVPIYFLSYTNDVEEGELTFQYMFIHISEALKFIKTSEVKMKNVKVDLLSPGHMNGSNGYRLAQIKQIWESTNGEILFLLENGEKIFSSSTENIDSFEGELVFSV